MFSDDGSLIAGRLGMLNAVGNIAGFIVGPVIAYIDEHWGRRWGIRCESSVWHEKH